ncbi:hypothetical protein like AT3G14470 [Hibiscus trionum]|uniref:Disease resistance protein RGA3 n=1 Tax=Hibiscus trionum TaxID=183268 RepID=A0A9W7HIF8_HIBTR|nr:hypothetical protein like AT3G14470 [Hibiscus trionum]
MAEALVSGVFERLTSISLQVAENGLRLVVGVNEDVENIGSTLRTIRAVLADAEKRQVKEQAVKLWLDNLQNVAYDIEDVLDEWSTAILRSTIGKSRSSSSSTFPVSRFEPPGISIPRLVGRRNIAVKIKELNERLQVIAKEKDDFAFIVNLTRNNDIEPERRPKTTCFIDVSEIRGRDQDKNTIARMLLSESSAQERGIPLISIVGMGGIGKTTLAQIVYNDREVNAYFQKKLWVCVSDPFDEMRVAKAILEALTGTPSSFGELNTVLEKIHEYVAGKRFLLVLDDVWTEDERKWQSLKCCLNSGAATGSKILVTTRKENVAAIMGCTKLFHLGSLSEEECWSLFSHIAFSARNDRESGTLADIGKKIADKCKGLPLAAKTLGGLLRFKRSREQWQRILDSRMWELDEAESGLFSPLLLSYYDLPPALRQCFSYCAIFPKDHKIEKDLLIKLWMAQGFLGEGNETQIVGEEYFDNLAMRSFFQEFEMDENEDSIMRCKMHDIVHEFALLLRKGECCVVASNGIEEQRAEWCHENARHVRVILDNEHAAIPSPLYNAKKLRSLIVDSCPRNTSSLNASLPGLFDQLTCLRMLDLSNKGCRRQTSITELPFQIGKLLYLRYLSLEGNNGLEYLPEALCDLCNLQTLNIRLCSNLKRLPFEIERLINLRHLQNSETYGCEFMGRGLQKLTLLQTLEEFVVVSNRSILYLPELVPEDFDRSSLGDLGSFAHLRGNLKIIGLGDVRRPTEAEEAGLWKKTDLRNLTLSFTSMCKDRRFLIEGSAPESPVLEASVLEALQPPPYLEYLNINRMNGPTAFPNWIVSLALLKRVTLGACLNWKTLPPMWKLPVLEHLEIWEMKNVKEVGQEFMGAETEKRQASSSSDDNNIAFPGLKHLTFQLMEEWQEWNYGNLLTTMPLLCSLRINSCFKLKSLPRQLLQKTTLQVLDIFDCPILKERCSKNRTAEDWPYISHIPTITIDGEDVQRDGN